MTRGELESYAQKAGVHWPANVLVQKLRDRGWLLDLKTRGVWEFAPAARAGAYGSGDPLIELRAALARRPGAPYAVAAESAAYLLGYASRRPDREVVSAPADLTIPPALRDYRVVRWQVLSPQVAREELPVWSSSTLLAFMATRPSMYHDWPNAGEWLARAAADASVDEVRREIEGRSRSAWAKAAHLLFVGGQPVAAQRLFAEAPKGSGPYYLGPRDRRGRLTSPYGVIDSTGMEMQPA